MVLLLSASFAITRAAIAGRKSNMQSKRTDSELLVARRESGLSRRAGAISREVRGLNIAFAALVTANALTRVLLPMSQGTRMVPAP